MLTFDAAARKFTTARNKLDGKPLENNTRLHQIDNDTYAVTLHHTNVVLIHRDGTYTLDSGGWRTVTTKERINSYSPARVYQKRGEWFLNDGGKFYDGVKINSAGRVLDPVQA